MPKPIFRWTLGPGLQQGRDILVESIKKTTKALGENNWNWVVMYNQIDDNTIEELKDKVKDHDIKFVKQTWDNCPIKDDQSWHTPQRRDGSFEWNGHNCGGSLWKVAVPRVRTDVHEIVMDNDIIILKKFPQIDQFLAQTEKVLILEEPIMFYGRYSKFFSSRGPYLNSGLMGFPPGYDFGKEIKRIWEFHGKLTKLSQADEQGLLMFALSQTPSIRIHTNQMIEILGRDFNAKVTGEEDALHFTQANRMPNHRAWVRYKELFTRN